CHPSHTFHKVIENFAVSEYGIYVSTEDHLYQLNRGLQEVTPARSVGTLLKIFVVFEKNGTLITCMTKNCSHCEVLDLKNISNTIYSEAREVPARCPRRDELVTLRNTQDKQSGGIFSAIGEGEQPHIKLSRKLLVVRFVDGFQKGPRVYLFLNIEDKSRPLVRLLWMRSSSSKADATNSVRSVTLECCEDKARAELVSSADVDGGPAGLWAGVFRGNETSDPTNTALALFDITEAERRVPRPDPYFCDSSCQLGEISLDENLKPTCPAVLHKSEDDRKFSRMILDPVDKKHLYVAMEKRAKCDDFSSTLKYLEPKISSITPNQTSFYGKNNVIVSGENLGNVAKMRIQENVNCHPKESPVLTRTSDKLTFHLPGGNKGVVTVCAALPNGKCFGSQNVRYGSLPFCNGLSPNTSWISGGRNIAISGENLNFVDEVIHKDSNSSVSKICETSRILKYLSPAQEKKVAQVSLKVANSTIPCSNLKYLPDPQFTRFRATPAGN
ncbi:hypothetical protein Z043_124023, partial [Scleropages formosus]